MDATTGDGFNTLAGYIFGANERRESMNMTTPVYTKVRELPWRSLELPSAAHDRRSESPH